jgi:putative membrane-bound dehydrogenase-like protein
VALLSSSPSPASPTPTPHLHPALEISLFAAEPLVTDPVALAFDGFGRMYVVEMRDYPFGLPPDHRRGGRIRCLEDTNHDGRADQATLFAEDLSFPTSITPWNGGILVTAPPEIVYLKDTTGDGRADHRETLLEGFRLGVTDSNVNGLRWGWDNWVHGANGGNGGNLRAPRHPDTTLRLGNHDFRFQPATGKVEWTAHTGGGFGLVFDDWGRSFTTYNIDHFQQRVADAADFQRFPGLPSVNTTHNIADHGEMARIYPVSPAQTRPNHPEQAGHFSAAGGMGFLSHLGWPSNLQGSALVGDVVGNLVHRDVLVPDGPIFRATRAPEEQTSEFFASRDPHCRPVGMEMGPDGALYLIDMQREVIEHPDYIPRKLLDTLDVRAGDDRGRIYRILPRDRDTLTRSLAEAGTQDPDHPDRERLPGPSSPTQRVALLHSPNPWTRFTTQRLLVEHPASAPLEALMTLANQPLAPARARFHALGTLEGLGRLDDTTLRRSLDAAEPELRESAVRLAASRVANSRTWQKDLLARVDDAHPMVRFQAVLGLTRFRPLDVPALHRYVTRDGDHPWSRRAAVAAAGPDAAALLQSLFQDPTFARTTDDARLELIRDLASVTVAGAPDGPATGLTRQLLESDLAPLGQATTVAFLHGLSEGVRRAGGLSADAALGTRLEALERSADRPLMAALSGLQRALGWPPSPRLQALVAEAVRETQDRSLNLSQRQEAASFLQWGAPDQVTPVLLTLLSGPEPAALQQTAFHVLRDLRDPSLARGLIAAWPSLSPVLRPAVVNLLVYRAPYQDALMEAIEATTLTLGELNLDLEQRRQLLRHAAPDIRQRAARWISDEEYAHRHQVVETWLAQLPPQGDPAAGRILHERLCASCHVVGGLGHAVGPDLSGMGHRSVEDLLSHILDPNMAMNPAYVAYTAERTDGEEETGILLSDTPERITLRQAAGLEVELPRTQLRSLRSQGRSLMPEGLEAGLTPQDLRDLIAYLQEPIQP